MTPQATAVVQVAGELGAADPVAATARSWQARLTGLGLEGEVVGPDLSRVDVVADLDGPDGTHDGIRHEVEGTPPTALDGPGTKLVVVHAVDGGESLAPLLPRLCGRRLTLVHHGSTVGSDRHVLRRLRSHTGRALAADAAAREELRALGFGDVRPLDPALVDLERIEPDPAVAAALAGHPAPRILSVGPLGPNRGVEALLDAFDELLTSHEPSAILSLCGSSTPWYRQVLPRTIATRGLLACEVVEPARDAEVVARLDDAAVLVALRPTGLAPYLRAAADRGVRVVAPLVEATAWIPPSHLVVPADGKGGLAAALAAGIARHRAAVSGSARDEGPSQLDRGLLAALGMR